MVRLWGANDQVYWREAANHRSLVQIPYCPWPSAELLHPMSFLTAEQDKLTAHVKGYSKHVGAAKAFKKSRVHKKKFLRTNPNLAHLTEGVHLNDWVEGNQATLAVGQFKQATYICSTGAKYHLSLPDSTPKIAAIAHASKAELQETALPFKEQHFRRPIHLGFQFPWPPSREWCWEPPPFQTW